MGTSRGLVRTVSRFSIWRGNNLDANELVGDLVGSPIKGAVSGLSSSLFGYIAAGIGIVVGGLVIWLWLVYGQLEKAELRVNEQKALVALKDAQIGGFVESIGRQNELINKLAVDTKESIDEMKTNAGKVETRYRDVQVPVKDASCEVKLKAYEDLLRVFAERGK